MTSQRSSGRSHILARILLYCYWPGLFILTHLPRVPLGERMDRWDKVAHFLAYAILAWLFTTAYRLRKRLGIFRYFTIFLLLAGYGVVDEVTQTWVGRQAEWSDWLADLLGISAGLCGYALWYWLSGPADD